MMIPWVEFSVLLYNIYIPDLAIATGPFRDNIMVIVSSLEHVR